MDFQVKDPGPATILIPSGENVDYTNPDGTVSVLAFVGKNVYVSNTSVLGNGVTLCDGVQIDGKAKVGDNTYLGVGFWVRHKAVIGKNCRLLKTKRVDVQKVIPDNHIEGIIEASMQLSNA